MCFILWFFRLSGRRKDLSHRSHAYTVSTVCLFMCLFKWPGVEKISWHASHVYIFSPVCILMCVLSLGALWNVAAQITQRCLAASVCIRCMCRFRIFWSASSNPQTSHINLVLSSLCLLMCTLRVSLEASIRGHSGQGIFSSLYTTPRFGLATRFSWWYFLS